MRNGKGVCIMFNRSEYIHIMNVISSLKLSIPILKVWIKQSKNGINVKTDKKIVK
jgi:hypothetical protein